MQRVCQRPTWQRSDFLEFIKVFVYTVVHPIASLGTSLIFDVGANTPT